MVHRRWDNICLCAYVDSNESDISKRFQLSILIHIFLTLQLVLLSSNVGIHNATANNCEMTQTSLFFVHLNELILYLMKSCKEVFN